ncbi:MAG: UDP-N-acetylmuramoyl-L-alanyl-D-glutamate--2,6-diaminopimelate ligase [Spirochaetia bacterium]|nr:UDP-N-acetylmuramoyl-L-alanyl-D-glutamate--2,6-diaminopimelate ligase [Spirochaetia bacterium]
MIIKIEELKKLGWYTAFDKESIEIKEITDDSRKVFNKTGFIAFDGISFKGKDFVFTALDKKASAVFVDEKYQREIKKDNRFKKSSPVFFAKNFRESTLKLIKYFFNEPAENINLIGITGTNGKTTIGQAIYNVLNLLSENTSYIGTLGYYFPDEKVESNLTTPGLIDLYRALSKAKEKTVKYTALEVSSHGLSQKRTEKLKWSVCIFTNLTKDHLDYHKTMTKYFESKKLLFKELLKNSKTAKGAVICVKDEYGQKLFEWLKSKKPLFPIVSLGKNANASITAVKSSWDGYSGLLIYNNTSYELKTCQYGVFNLYNMASVFLALTLLGFDSRLILKKIELLPAVPGRMDIIHAKNGRKIIVDYAHTPDALMNVLLTIKELTPRKIITIFGCGGNRDKKKRPIMGKIAADFSDHVIITNDNPRDENPENIVNDIIKGISNKEYEIIYDRRKAIETGIKKLRKNECLLIAGKGHEDYQIIGKNKISFDDKLIAEEILKNIVLV